MRFRAIACQHCASAGVVPVTASPYDAALSALRPHVEDLAAWLAVWEARHEPDAHARRCASDAVDAVDAMLRDLHQVRARAVVPVVLTLIVRAPRHSGGGAFRCFSPAGPPRFTLRAWRGPGGMRTG